MSLEYQLLLEPIRPVIIWDDEGKKLVPLEDKNEIKLKGSRDDSTHNVG